MNALRHLATLDVRADRSAFRRYDLAPPERRESGAMVYEAVLASPGVSDYPELGIRERVTPEALSDPAWLAGLAGLPIIDDADLHWRGVTVDDLPAARIGTILDARWDDTQQVAVVRMVIDTERGLRLIRSGVLGLSVTYTPDSVPVSDDPDGATHEQRRRHTSDHVLLTDTPRDIAARIRADATGGQMADDTTQDLAAQIEALRADLAKRADMEGGDMLSMLLDMLMSARNDAMQYEQKMADMQKRMDEMQAEPEAEPDEPRADAWRQALATAERVGVEVADDARLADVQRAVVAKHLPSRADAQGDALTDAYALTIEALDAAEANRERGAGWRRADQSTTPVGDDVIAALTY